MHSISSALKNMHEHFDDVSWYDNNKLVPTFSHNDRGLEKPSILATTAHNEDILLKH